MSTKTASTMSSVLGPSAVVLGNIRGTGDLEIRGRVQGSVEIAGRILVAESGVVLGGIEATQIKVAGEVRGNLQAEDGVTILASAQVEGDIIAPRVGIEAGAKIRGMLRTGAELPKKEELVSTHPAAQEPRRELDPPKALESAPKEAARPREHEPRAEPPRLRKRKRPRPPGALAGPEKAPIKELVEAKGARLDPAPVEAKSGKTPRGPKGPPKVPTVEKGAKGRPRSES
jgi:cytoskeletal protein CcmA (bactofilin family)